MSIYYTCAAITMISALVSFGFSVEAFIKSKNMEREAFTNAMYAMSRSCALALSSFVPYFFHSIPYLSAISIIMIVVQAIDAVIGFKIGNKFKTYGPMLTSIGNLIFFICLIYSL